MSAFYLADKYQNKLRLRAVRDELEALGHTVTSRWIDETEDPQIQLEDVPEEKRREYARHDLEDILDAEYLVHFQDKDFPNKRGGAIEEKGMARGLGKEIILVGDRVTIFDYLHDTVCFPTLRAFLKWAKDHSGEAADMIDHVADADKKVDTKPVSFDTQRVSFPSARELMKMSVKERRPYLEKSTEAYAEWYWQTWAAMANPVDFDGFRFPGIGISGKAKSGKDLLCKMLLERLGPEWRREAFADALKVEWYKQVVGETCTSAKIIIEHVNREKEEWGVVRQQLIDLGQARRAEDPLYWVKRVNLQPGCIITDVRFGNEFQALKDKGFLMVRIECTPETLASRGQFPIDDPSECELDGRDDWDIVVNNNGPAGVLETAADEIVKSVQSVQSVAK
jgi:phosphomevalonate kinase